MNLRTNQIPSLESGDTIAIVSSARKVTKEDLIFAVNIIESLNLKIYFGNNLFKDHHQFSGTRTQRTHDLQSALDDRDIKAILFARGGYGSVQIVDSIDWDCFEKNPKWLVGFSDVTVFHAHIFKNFGIPSIHGPMPITLPKNSKSSLTNFKKILFGKEVCYKIKGHPLNRKGKASAIVVGGNLSILYSLLGSKSQLNTDNKILFIEDVDEYLYHIDRMMQSLKRARMLNNLSGLIVGGMTNMKDNKIPFGKNAQEIIYNYVYEFDYPICFGFPAGHINNNHPIVFGEMICLEVDCDSTIK